MLTVFNDYYLTEHLDSIPCMIYFFLPEDPELIPGIYFLPAHDPEIIPDMLQYVLMDPSRIS